MTRINMPSYKRLFYACFVLLLSNVLPVVALPNPLSSQQKNDFNPSSHPELANGIAYKRADHAKEVAEQGTVLERGQKASMVQTQVMFDTNCHAES